MYDPTMGLDAPTDAEPLEDPQGPSCFFFHSHCLPVSGMLEEEEEEEEEEEVLIEEEEGGGGGGGAGAGRIIYFIRMQWVL